MKIFVLHIPKTGGTSISNYFTDYFDGDVFGISHRPDLISDFEMYGDQIINKYSFIQGHTPLCHVHKYMDSFDFVIAVIRNPFARLISHYNYIDSDINFDDFLNAYYINNVATRNEQCGYVGLINTFESVLQVLHDHKKFKIFDYDRLNEQFQTFCTQKSLGSGVLPILNRSENSKYTLADLSSNIPAIDKICSWFSGDFMLYSYLKLNKEFR